MTAFYVLNYIAEFAIVPAAVAGVARFGNILPADRPLVYLLCLGTLSEVLALILAYTIQNNIICFNIYEIFDALVTMQLFYNWGCLRQYKRLYRLLQLSLLLLWGIEDHNLTMLMSDTPAFRIVYSIVLTLMGIDCVNRFIIHERRSLLNSGRFLAAMAIIFNGTFQTIRDIMLWIYPGMSQELMVELFEITTVILFLANLAFLLAIVKLPRRERMVLPVS